jgi:hypothetical protein
LLRFKTFFEIPEFQRWYSWKDKHVSQFFDDITQSLEMDEIHSFGSIEASKKVDDDGEPVPIEYELNGEQNPHHTLHVSDGQQRLTTMFLFWFAAAHYERENGNPGLFDDLQGRFFRKDNIGAEVGTKLMLQESDLTSALKSLCRRGNLDDLQPAQCAISAVKRMKRALDLIKVKLAEADEVGELEDIWDQFQTRTEVVLIQGEANAAVKFEVRNNRGIGVNELDKTKNMIELIESRTGTEFGFASNWYGAMKKMDKHRLEDSDDELLGYTQTVHTGNHWGKGSYDALSDTFGELTTKETLDALEETGLTNFITAFDDMATAYCAVFSPSADGTWNIYGQFPKYRAHANWNGQMRGKLVAKLTDICLRLDRKKVFDAVILAMYHKLEDPQQLYRCLVQLEKVVFRVYLVRAKPRTSFGLQFRMKLAKKIYDWNRDQATLVNTILSDLCNFCITHKDDSIPGYPGTSKGAMCTLFSLYEAISKEDPAYSTRWSLYFLYHWQVRKYKNLLLGSVTKAWGDTEKGAPDEETVAGRTRKRLFEKEHILPQNGWNGWAPEADGEFYWTRAPNHIFEQRNDFIRTKDYIGNLVMSKGRLNSRYSNHPYLRKAPGDADSAKRDLYLANRDWSQVRAVAKNYSEWNKNTIKDRQERLSRWAIKRWKLECAADALQPDDIPDTIPFIDEHTDEFRQERTEGGHIPDDDEDNAIIDIARNHDEQETYLDVDDDEDIPALQPPSIPDDLEGYDFPEDFYAVDE